MYKSFHIYFRVVAYCSSLLQPDADLSYGSTLTTV